jgi:hypothetical protein
VGHAHVLRTVPEEAFGGKTVAFRAAFKSSRLPTIIGKRVYQQPFDLKLTNFFFVLFFLLIDFCI